MVLGNRDESVVKRGCLEIGMNFLVSPEYHRVFASPPGILLLAGRG